MKQLITLGMLLLIGSNALIAWDNLHFYRASFFFGEPRFERDKLTTFNARVGAGSTTQARNACSQKVCLLDLFGPQVTSKIGEGVPYKNLNLPQDLTLQLLEQEPGGNNFGLISFGGRFKTVELDLQLYQNICNGFFFEIYMPIRKLAISDICCNDLSSTCPPCPNAQNIIWQAFLNQYDAILASYGLCQTGIDRTGIGDTSVLGGWAINFEDTEHLDFIDITLQAGVLFPTGRTSNPNVIFDLPLGYNGHYGFPLNMSIAFGLYEWLTWGGNVMAMPFKNAQKELRMKTSIAQNGFIKLAKGCADVHHGSIWQVTTYFKADHIIRNISFLLGYSYSSERSSTLYPDNTCIFNPGVVNSDEMLRGWSMHTMHLLCEFDFLKEGHRWGPRLALLGNIIAGGKRIFNTHIGGGSVGIDIVWNY